MMNKNIIIIVGIIILFFVFFMNQGSKFLPVQRKTDQEVEVPSVADVAMTSGACGMRPPPM
jgi:hypothetical protein